MKEKTSTCPMGDSGMTKMMTTGTMVIRSLAMRRRMLTWREKGRWGRGVRRKASGLRAFV
jgi:hypothetical protein